MIDTLTEILLIAGIAGTGALWAFAVAGMLQLGWQATGAHVVHWYKNRE
jgi:hypothetical protein